jgi:copper chaperone CopZ
MSRIYDVPGISCDRCKDAIEQDVRELDGIVEVDVDIAARTVRVEGSASVQAVRAAIDQAGYEVAAVR